MHQHVVLGCCGGGFEETIVVQLWRLPYHVSRAWRYAVMWSAASHRKWQDVCCAYVKGTMAAAAMVCCAVSLSLTKDFYNFNSPLGRVNPLPYLETHSLNSNNCMANKFIYLFPVIASVSWSFCWKFYNLWLFLRLSCFLNNVEGGTN